MFIAETFCLFRELFVMRLQAMLSDDGLGAFILVLANSQQDEDMNAVLKSALKKNFALLRDNYETIKINSPRDDVDVFEKLIAMDLDALPLWRYRAVGQWQLVCNSVRQLRPARAALQTFSSIRQEFDENRFHFNKPFLQPEILWEGEYRDEKLRILYNKFPFADYHLLIALSPQLGQAQLLTEKAHRTIFSLIQDAATVFPGFGIGFNSLAAGASVNHLHFQGFIRQDQFPIEKKCWQHNGGEMDYPLAVTRFTDASSSWEYLFGLIDSDVAFNCLYRNGSCYVIPRKYQGSVALPGWLAGAGWLDVAGVITVSDEETFGRLDEAAVSTALQALKPGLAQ